MKTVKFNSENTIKIWDEIKGEVKEVNDPTLFEGNTMEIHLNKGPEIISVTSGKTEISENEIKGENLMELADALDIVKKIYILNDTESNEKIKNNIISKLQSLMPEMENNSQIKSNSFKNVKDYTFENVRAFNLLNGLENDIEVFSEEIAISLMKESVRRNFHGFHLDLVMINRKVCKLLNINNEVKAIITSPEKMSLDEIVFDYKKIMKLNPHATFMLPNSTVDVDGTTKGYITFNGKGITSRKYLALEKLAKETGKIVRVFSESKRRIVKVYE